jgi:hypothetical protein
VDLALLGVLGELVLVLGDLLGLGGGASDLERAEVSLPLEALGGDEARGGLASVQDELSRGRSTSWKMKRKGSVVKRVHDQSS